MREWNFENVTFKYSTCIPQKTMERLNQLDDPLEAMRRLNREHDQIPFILSNLKAFKEHGALEKAVVEVYLFLMNPCGVLGIDVWGTVFDLCDREKLLMAPGVPFCPLQPDGFSIYRSAAAEGTKDLRWTISRETAGGEPLHARANMDDVAFFTNDREELEVILHPGSQLFVNLG